jgi:hypothetical protein
LKSITDGGKEDLMAFCQNCGSILTNTNLFCGTCGARISAETASGKAAPNQVIPVQRTISPKNKTVSILLAIFLTFWTWLYTYKRDGWKFWTGFAVSSLPLLVSVAMMATFTSTSSDNLLIGLGYLLPTAVWLLAIADSVSKKQAWFDSY